MALSCFKERARYSQLLHYFIICLMHQWAWLKLSREPGEYNSLAGRCLGSNPPLSRSTVINLLLLMVLSTFQPNCSSKHFTRTSKLHLLIFFIWTWVKRLCVMCKLVHIVTNPQRISTNSDISRLFVFVCWTANLLFWSSLTVDFILASGHSGQLFLANKLQ